MIVERKTEARGVLNLVIKKLLGGFRDVIRCTDLHLVPRAVQVLEHLLEPIRVAAYVREGLAGREGWKEVVRGCDIHGQERHGMVLV